VKDIMNDTPDGDTSNTENNDPEKDASDNNTSGAVSHKPTENPQTGDTGNMAMWFTMILISGVAVITRTMIRKRKA
jgi:hypothetical protein